MFICVHCNSHFPKLNLLGNHTRWCKENPNSNRNILDNRPNGTRICKVCQTQFELRYPKDRKTTCSKKCQGFMSEEARTKISNSRKEFLRQHPDLHTWKRKDKNVSVPCENFKKFLRSKNIDFVEEYSPLSDRFYSMDIALPNLKIAFEINGNQHYNKDGTLRSYYQKRHDEIVASGWSLIEIHYSNCFSDANMLKFIDFDIPMDSNIEIEKIKEFFRIKKEKQKPLPRGQKAKNKTDAKWLELKDTIFDQGIDFTRYGWNTVLSRYLQIKPQKVHEWMIRYHPEFYKSEKCFKRKSTRFVL